MAQPRGGADADWTLGRRGGEMRGWRADGITNYWDNAHMGQRTDGTRWDTTDGAALTARHRTVSPEAGVRGQTF